MNLSIHNVSKRYNKGKKPALEDFSIQFKPGIYGVLGPNGAGKTTLLNIMTDNLKPDTGEVTFDGVNISRMGKGYRETLGYMPQQQGLYEDFTGTRFLWYMAALKGLKRKQAAERIEHLLQVVNLKQDENKKLGSYSGGMKQRILIAQALINDPKVLILDEPTAGLDPKERIRLRNFISTIALKKIVIIATHVVSDIEFIAKQVILVNQGKLLAQDDPEHLLESIKGKVFEAQMTEEQLLYAQKHYKVSNIMGEKDRLNVRIVGDHAPAEWTTQLARPNLEDLYLYMFDE